MTHDEYMAKYAPPVASPSQTPSESTAGPLGAVSSFLGLDKLGIGLGRTINNATGQPDQLLQLSQQHSDSTQKLAALLKDPNTAPDARARITNLLRNNNDYAAQAYGDVATGGITNKEVLGSAAQTALDIGLAGAPNLGAESGVLAKEAAPAAIKAGIGAAAKRIGVKAAVGGAQGAAIGTAQGLTDNQSLGDSLKQGLETGAIGTILGGAVGSIPEAIRGLTAPKLAETLYNHALGVGKSTIQAGRSPAAAMIQNGLVGTAQKLYDHAQGVIDDVDPKITAILGASEKTVPTATVFDKLAETVNTSVGNVGKGSLTSDDIKQVIQDTMPQVRTLLNKENLTLAEANKLRQVMDRTLGDRAFTGATLPFKKDVLFDASNSLRNIIKDAAPETKALFSKYSTNIQVVKALNNEMSKPHNLRHMLSLLSAVGGGPLGVGAAALNEGAQTTLAQTAAAVGLHKAGTALSAFDSSAKAALVSRLAKAGLVKVASKLSSSQSGGSQ
jgi:hypothetical protein